MRILATIIRQLCQNNAGEIFQPVADVYKMLQDQKPDQKQPLTINVCKNLLLRLTNIHPFTTICIDALDEIEKETCSVVLRALKETLQKSQNLVQVFATARMDLDIAHQLSGFPTIELVPDDNFEDVKYFVKTKVRRAVEDGKLLPCIVDSEFEEEICEILYKKSKGM